MVVSCPCGFLTFGKVGGWGGGGCLSAYGHLSLPVPQSTHTIYTVYVHQNMTKCVLSAAPVLNVGTADVSTSTNQPTTLICVASGNPAPVVTWSRNGEPLDVEKFIQLADGSLFVNDTDIQDEGTYIVKATNSAGTSEADVRVTVVRPVPPEREWPNHCFAMFYVISWLPWCYVVFLLPWC